MPANISSDTAVTFAKIFGLLGQPNRIFILLVIGRDEACVCHIEAAIGIRQATISQHLMVLRDAGLVTTQRNGRNIFYRLVNPDLFDAICHLATSAGIPGEEIGRLMKNPVPGCPCPHCNPETPIELTCQKQKPQVNNLTRRK